jgi:hypothetical protein
MTIEPLSNVQELKVPLSNTITSNQIPKLLTLDKIVVAIQGIGNQRHSDTIRAVARRFGSRSEPPLPIMPLGYFFLENEGQVRISRLDVPRIDENIPSELERIGFVEVFWAVFCNWS